MKMKAAVASISLLILLVAFGRKACADPASEAAAAKSADAWLALVDGRKLGESWDTASKLFRGAVARDQWVKTVEGVRGPLGKLLSRKLKSKQFTTTLPGAPDGRYVILQYDATYVNKKEAVETVTPMLEGDGQWRVSGYFIR